MADDNSARYRSNDAYGRGPAPAGPASDPLAELARLIGQNEPVPAYGGARRLPQAQPEPPLPSEPDPDPLPSVISKPAPQYYDDEPSPLRYVNEPAPPPYLPPEPAPPRYAAAPPQQRHDNYPATHNDWPGSPPTPPPLRDLFSSPQQQYAPAPPQQYAPAPGGQVDDNQGYVSPNYANPPPPPSLPSQLFGNPQGRPADRYQPDPAGFDAAGYPATPDRQGYAPPRYAHQQDAGGMPPPHDDEYYDDAPSSPGRRGLLTVVAVLALAVLGTAGAFGYRSFFSGPGSSGPPPVIRASGEPSKVAPPPASPDQSVGKFSYDRFGDAGKDEQVVKREEKPVDVSKAAPPPRTVFPGAPVPSTPSAKSVANNPAAANPPSAIGEPRRVRTVPIRPDAGGTSASAAGQPEPMSVAPPPRQVHANATPPSAPATRPADPAPSAAAASARASTRTAARQAPARDANAPLSLSPDANNDPLPPPVTQSPAPRVAAPSTRVASAPAAGGGSYLVQVSSQRSEADAETSFRGIQSKYSSVLGGQPHQVRRADLGAKGVYYRAMVGPFGSREQAVQLCSSLKQAGGDCVVQH